MCGLLPWLVPGSLSPASQLPCLYSSKNYDTSSLVPLSSLPTLQFLPLLPLRAWAAVSQTHYFLEMMEEIGILLLSPQWFSVRVILFPRGQLALSGDVFGCQDLGGWCYWHLRDRSQRCY